MIKHWLIYAFDYYYYYHSLIVYVRMYDPYIYMLIR